MPRGGRIQSHGCPRLLEQRDELLGLLQGYDWIVLTRGDKDRDSVEGREDRRPSPGLFRVFRFLRFLKSLGTRHLLIVVRDDLLPCRRCHDLRHDDHLPRLKRLSLPRSRPYDLRHFSGTFQVGEGVDYRTVSSRLGTSDPRSRSTGMCGPAPAVKNGLLPLLIIC